MTYKISKKTVKYSRSVVRSRAAENTPLSGEKILKRRNTAVDGLESVLKPDEGMENANG